jgi:hypothetical protein
MEGENVYGERCTAEISGQWSVKKIASLKYDECENMSYLNSEYFFLTIEYLLSDHCLLTTDYYKKTWEL